MRKAPLSRHLSTFARHTVLLLSVACCLIQSTGHAKDRQPQMFSDGARWSAIGDSITHGGSYYAWVYLYYATRFPEQDLHVSNCGISGDTTWGTLRRYEWDIAPTAPTTATIMLGMNDVGRSLYGKDETPALAKDRAHRVDLYERKMRMLVQRLKQDGVEITLITPSPYDDTAQIEMKNLEGVNAKLGELGDFIRQLADEEDLAVIDFHDAMTTLNEELQANDPDFTLIGPDRVHPRWPGHFVMAYLMLSAQDAPSLVSRVAIDTTRLSAETERAQVTDLRHTDGNLTFTCREEALPYPISASVKPALDYVPFTEELNQETLIVSGLKAGHYTLTIDGTVAGSFSAQELAAGVNLAKLTATPQYQQALDVLKLVTQWRQQVATLRGLAFIEHSRLKDLPKPVALDEARPLLKKQLRELTPDAPHASYYTRSIQSYLKNKPQEAEIRARIQNLEDEIKQASQPKPHHYTISPDAHSPS